MATVPEQVVIRVEYAEDVLMGGGDAPWTIPAGTTGRAYRDGNRRLTVTFDTPVAGHTTAYAEEHKLRAL